MNKYDKLLEQYVDGKYFRQPHLVGSFNFTTDGRFLLAVPVELCENAYETQERLKNPLVVLNVPFLPTPKAYDGKKILANITKEELEKLLRPAECLNCFGDGTCECGCGVSHQCGKCNGSGVLSQSEYIAEFDGKYFQFRLLQIVFDIADKFNNGEFLIVSDTSEITQTLFKVQDIYICVMPCKNVNSDYTIKLSELTENQYELVEAG